MIVREHVVVADLSEPGEGWAGLQVWSDLEGGWVFGYAWIRGDGHEVVMLRQLRRREVGADNPRSLSTHVRGERVRQINLSGHKEVVSAHHSGINSLQVWCLSICGVNWFSQPFVEEF